MSITLDDNWAMYKPKDGSYQGYFEIGSQPENWILSNVYYVTCKEFLEHLHYVDAGINLAFHITRQYFSTVAQQNGLEIEFEDIVISRLDAVELAITELTNDKERFIDSYGAEYDDWQHFDSLIGMLSNSSDFYIMVEGNTNDEIVNLIYEKLGLSSHKDIFNYELDELSLNELIKFKEELQ